MLDKILFALIEEQKSNAEIMALGFPKHIVDRVSKLLHSSEYKRKQAAPGVKISDMSFDKERRIPITNNFCD
jgi:NH3-dependent NAD+ synthetase